MITVAITSIGSGVGQSVIDSCRLSDLPIVTIGLGANPFAFGAYDCDVQDTLPNIYSKEYINVLIEKCKKYKVDILIPGLDDELIFISKNIKRFTEVGIVPIVAGVSALELCRDKVMMSEVLNSISDIFVKSYSKNSLIENFNKNNIEFPLIAKPISGFASNGIFVVKSELDFQMLTDKHVIQEIAMPSSDDFNYINYSNNLENGIISQVSEISAQIVIGREGDILGKCVTYNKLKNGAPIEIVPYESDELWEVLDDVIKYLIDKGLRGPINIQGRKTNKGFKFFEMNARFTGITGLRAIMGFNEVEALIKNFLDVNSKWSQLELNSKRIGIRQVKNRVIEPRRNDELDKAVIQLGYHNWNKQLKTVLVTGATGFLGQTIVDELYTKDEVGLVICLVRNKKMGQQIYDLNEKALVIDISDIENGVYNLGNVDILIHTAFGRSKDGFQAIADGLRFTNWIFNKVYFHNIPSLINISSQAVYGLSRKPLWDESLIPMPETAYAQAKWASELMAMNQKYNNHQTTTTSVRLASIIGKNMGANEFTHKIINRIFNKEAIEIRGGMQKFDLLDVSDAAKGIVGLLDLPFNKWKNVYNLGSGKQANIIDLANEINFTAEKCGLKKSEIILSREDINLNIGMSIDRICADTGWKPNKELKDSLFEIIQYQKGLLNID